MQRGYQTSKLARFHGISHGIKKRVSIKQVMVHLIGGEKSHLFKIYDPRLHIQCIIFPID